MAIEIGKKGLAEVNLVIPQGASLAFAIVHKDAAGEVIDHSQSTIRMALQSRNGVNTYDMSEYCAGGAEQIAVGIPPEVTAELPKGALVWDIFAEMADDVSVRLAYGSANVVDTYALDGE